MNNTTIIISVLSLFVSGWTFWATRIKRGSIRMTRPSIICFLGSNGNDQPKVFIRTLLYGTSEQGQYIQNMHIRMIRGLYSYEFSVWAYGDNGMVRGSGLFLSKAGISTYHHFLLSKNDTKKFIAGDYLLLIYAETVKGKTIKLFEHRLSLTEQEAIELAKDRSIEFDWFPIEKRYISHSEPPKPKSAVSISPEF